MNKLYLITGPAGVGKSTISKALALKLPKSVLIEGDDIYHLVSGGYISPWKPGNHMDLFWENSISLIENSLKHGYDVVFNYIIKKQEYEKLKEIFKSYEVIFKVLLVDEEELLRRDKLRDEDCRMHERCLILLNKFKEQKFNKSLVIDTTNLTVEETLNEIIGGRMNINQIRTPNDILSFMEENIDYGWVGIDGKKRVRTMDDFRKFYRTSLVEETIQSNVGTCIEQVNLMHYLMNKIDIESKMFCTRMYEDETFDDLKAPERMHCFLLFYVNDKVYQLEHPDDSRIGIHSYESEEAAIEFLVSHYEKNTEEEYKRKNKPAPANGFKRITTEFFEVPEGLSYKDFNLYINSLGSIKRKS